MSNSFLQREKRIRKMNSTLLFFVKEQSLETRKLRKLLAKEEEERYQKVIKKLCVKVIIIIQNASQGLAFIHFSCLVKKTIGRIITLRKT